ncbi:MAG: VWA domain-containing protein [Nitrospinae bacterium]|nr:VWA domain-containing protein [Nitrospinota bacterium]
MKFRTLFKLIQVIIFFVFPFFLDKTGYAQLPEGLERCKSGNSLILLLIDESSSTKESAEIYRNSAQQIVNSLTQCDHLTAIAIREDSISKAVPIVNIEIPKPKSISNTIKEKRYKTAYEDYLRTTKTESIKKINDDMKKSAKKTDIFSALKYAGDFFKQFSNFQSKRLIILSDMIHATNPYNFKTNLPSVMDVEAHLKKNNLEPDLSNVDVYIVTGISDVSGKAYGNIQGFWKDFLKKYHAVEKGYSNTLLNY